MLHSRISSWAFPQTIDQSGEAASLLQKFVNYGQKKFYNIGPESTNGTVLLANVGMVWKRLTVTNTLAYFGADLITAVKWFILQAQELGFTECL